MRGSIIHSKVLRGPVRDRSKKKDPLTRSRAAEPSFDRRREAREREADEDYRRWQREQIDEQEAQLERDDG